MEKNKNAWKDHLLKSGIPLEFEVIKFLNQKGCVSRFDQTYLRNNENLIATEFSYDIDSSYIRGNHFIDLMIECKYRHDSTKWVFLPEHYRSDIDDITTTGFMHPIDHFNTKKQPQIDFPITFAPLCSKGIELTSQGPNPKTITQATAQLSYGMAHKIVSAIQHQTDEILSQHFNGTIFYSIPVIITTAHLYRLREDIDIETIQLAENIESISTQVPYLIVKAKPGSDLATYNRKILMDFVLGSDIETLKSKLNSYNNDLFFVINNLASDDCPNSIVIIQHTKENIGLTKFFDFIDRVINPDEEIFDLVKKKQEEIDSFLKKFEEDHPGADLSGGYSENEM